MRKFAGIFLLGALLVAGCDKQAHNSPNANTHAPANSTAADRPEVVDRLADSAKVLDQLMGAPDSSIPSTVLEGAKCVGVIPSMIKGGFVIGGRHGRGVITCRTQGGAWSAPVFYTVSGGSWGPQIGVEAVDVVMLFMNDKSVEALLHNNFKMGADASVAAGPVGRDAQAATDASLQAGILTYSRARGLFAGLSLNGAAVRPDEDSMKALYGTVPNFREPLMSTTIPAQAQDFVATVRKYFREAQAK